MSCFQDISPTFPLIPSSGVYVSSHHHPYLHNPSSSPDPPAESTQKSSRQKMEVESPSQRWCLNVRSDDISATHRCLLSSALTRRTNRSPDGVTSSSLPNDDADQRPENAEYLGNNCVLLTYFSGDIGSHVDEHFSRALSHLQQQQQKVVSTASNEGLSHQSSISLADRSIVKDCKTPSQLKESYQRLPPSTAYYSCPNRTQYLSTSIDVGVPHDDVISSFDDWRYSFGAAFTNGAVYDQRCIRGSDRSQISPLIKKSLNTDINCPNSGDRRQSAVSARWTPYERWRRLERTADDAISFTSCDRSLSRSSMGGMASSCQLQLPSPSKQTYTSDLYWF